tara:strand:+ start:1784 stop:1915 length:132 start_codon:yes stop_codon:yes gene_type:complete
LRPIGGFYRYIGEEKTSLAFRDELKDYEERRTLVPLENEGFAL